MAEQTGWRPQRSAPPKIQGSTYDVSILQALGSGNEEHRGTWRWDRESAGRRMLKRILGEAAKPYVGGWISGRNWCEVFAW
jgi:hypothetical protein